MGGGGWVGQLVWPGVRDVDGGVEGERPRGGGRGADAGDVDEDERGAGCGMRGAGCGGGWVRRAGRPSARCGEPGACRGAPGGAAVSECQLPGAVCRVRAKDRQVGGGQRGAGCERGAGAPRCWAHAQPPVRPARSASPAPKVPAMDTPPAGSRRPRSINCRTSAMSSEGSKGLARNASTPTSSPLSTSY